MSVGPLFFLLAAANIVEPADTTTFAVIVANNAPKPGATGLAQLRYADDDGARFYEFFEMFAQRIVIHSVLDDESQRLHPEVAKVARVPSRGALERTLTETFEAIEAERLQGRKTELFFIFVGHGSALESGEGVMHFLDGGFTRSDLFQKIIARSPADTNHVLIDACNAFLFVAGRGDASKSSIDRAVDQYLARETVQRYPNTGFLLSTSATTEVHEWSGFRAGVFSHEVRSAMIGGADVDGDGAVTYDEVRAFLNAANGRVQDPRAKLSPWVAPPAIRRQTPLVQRTEGPNQVATVHVPGGLAGRWSVEDTRGVRLADVNVAPDGPVTLVLSPKRDHVLRGSKVEITLPSTMSKRLDAQNLARRDIPVRARGLETSFREGLFALPFGLAFYQGYTAANPLPVMLVAPAKKSEASTQKWVGGSLVAVSVAALATGVVFGAMAANDAEDYRQQVGLTSDIDALRRRAQNRETLSNIFLGVGAAAGIGGVALLVW
ncbi:MAG: hypothetical protein AAF449_02960 [Myxococcota bacterium]